MSHPPARHRNYRILRVSSIGQSAAGELLYRDEESLRCASYAEQLRSWLARKVGHADALSRVMKSLGHEAQEIVCDLEPLQRTWAWERGVDVTDRDWRTQVVTKQICDWKPEVLYLQNYDVLPPQIRRDLKGYFPSVELLVIQQRGAEQTPALMRELATADVLITSSPLLERACRKAGLFPHLVYEGFDPGVLSELPAPSQIDERRLHDFSFAGTTGVAAGYAKRHTDLVRLLEHSPLEVWACESTEATRPRRRLGRRECTITARAGARGHGAVFGLDYYGVLQRSRVTFDAPRDRGRGFVDSTRLFEATGVGTCLLTAASANVEHLFEDGREIVTYTGIDDCLEKVEYLLEHDAERGAIANAGRTRTLSQHTVRNRAKAIDEVIQEALAANRRAKRQHWNGLPGSLPA